LSLLGDIPFRDQRRLGAFFRDSQITEDAVVSDDVGMRIVWSTVAAASFRSVGAGWGVR
jgi:hypothetical protein